MCLSVGFGIRVIGLVTRNLIVEVFLQPRHLQISRGHPIFFFLSVIRWIDNEVSEDLWEKKFYEESLKQALLCRFVLDSSPPNRYVNH